MDSVLILLSLPGGGGGVLLGGAGLLIELGVRMSTHLGLSGSEMTIAHYQLLADYFG